MVPICKTVGTVIIGEKKTFVHCFILQISLGRNINCGKYRICFESINQFIYCISNTRGLEKKIVHWKNILSTLPKFIVLDSASETCFD